MKWLENAIEMFDECKRKDGEILSADWIKCALMIMEPKTVEEANKASFAMLQRFDIFRRYLLEERSIALENIRGEGYRIVPPRDQARVAVETATKYWDKGIKKSQSLLINTRMEKLTNSERRRHIDVHIKLTGFTSILRREKPDVFLMLSAGDTDD